MVKFRNGNPTKKCQIYKWDWQAIKAKPYKVCSYYTVNMNCGRVDELFTCGRPEGCRCRPLYYKVSDLK